jgi:hypothetical protein
MAPNRGASVTRADELRRRYGVFNGEEGFLDDLVGPEAPWPTCAISPLRR